MGKLTKVLSLVCSAALIFSVPSVSLANLEQEIALLKGNAAKRIEKIDETIGKLEKTKTSRKAKLISVEGKIGNLQKEIDDLLKQFEKEKVNEDIVSRINSIKSDLAKEKDNCNGCREMLDSLTAALLSNEQGEEDEELLLSKSVAQENFDKSSKKVQELEDELKRLETLKYDCKDKDLKIKLEKLNEEKSQHEKRRNELKEGIERCERKCNNLVNDRKQVDEMLEDAIDVAKHLDQENKAVFKMWNNILSGDQNENNVLDGQKIEKTCGIFAATNAINHYVSSYYACDGVTLIQGFNNVIQSYLSHGGKKENLNKVLGYEELKEYLNKFKFRRDVEYILCKERSKRNIAFKKEEPKEELKEELKEEPKKNEDIPVTDEEVCRQIDMKRFEDRHVDGDDLLRRGGKIRERRIISRNLPISTYNVVYEERLCNIPDLKKEIQKQEENIKDILISHFTELPDSRLPSPVLNLNNGHWQTFVAYDRMDDRILLVDSSPARVEWVDLDAVLKNAISVHEDKLHWDFVFLTLDISGENDYFGIDLGNPFTEEQKARVIRNVSLCCH